MKITRCACGNRMSRYSERCNLCHSVRMAEIHSLARRIVATGKCPGCGAALKLNTSMAGWWQCGRYGCDSFRLPEYRGTGDCSFQTFTE